MPLTVNAERLRRDLESLAQIGGAGFGSPSNRPALSKEHISAKIWLSNLLAAAELNPSWDIALNVVGRYDSKNPSLPVVVVGSHMDTVPNGGHLDGALGVIAGLECLRTIKEANIEVGRSIELVDFTDEEGHFCPFMGSRAAMGDLSEGEIMTAISPDGVMLRDAMIERGLNATNIKHAVRNARDIHAFVELHIEQGPVLENEHLAVGIVDQIVGLFRLRVVFEGEARHAGTTPMDARRDAFRGVSGVSNHIDRILAQYGSESSRATIGHVRLSPGAVNVIPERGELILEVRDGSVETLSALEVAFRETIVRIAEENRLTVRTEKTGYTRPCTCEGRAHQALLKSAATLGVSHRVMPSGAGHDAQIMGKKVDAGLIFVPSIDGISHSARESTTWANIETGANVLLHSLIELATIGS